MKSRSCISLPAAPSIHYCHPAVIAVMASPEPQFLCVYVCACVDTDWFSSDQRRSRDMGLG